MKKTNKLKLEEFIRVDHAGERGAVKIYEGQLLALNTLVKDVDSIQSAAITSNAILPVNSFEELRVQFNNLVVDVGNI